jgi:hypothetical protein
MSGKMEKKEYGRYYYPYSWDETPLSCVWCEGKFNSKQAVELHVRYKHQFNCNDCMKEFAMISEFMKHAKECVFAQQHVPFFVKQYFK